MRLIEALGYCFFIHRPQGLQQLPGCLNGVHHLAPIHSADGIDVFLGNLFVGDAHRLVRPAIGQVPQMHQQGKYIIPTSKGSHVIRKGAGVDFNTLTCQHFDHCVLEAVHIHLDVDLQRLVGFGLVPIGIVGMAEHRIHHRLRAVHGIHHLTICMLGHQFITIIPRPRFLEAHVVGCTQFAHLILGEAKVFCQLPGIGHRILREHIQGGVRTVLFDGQDARHVG